MAELNNIESSTTNEELEYRLRITVYVTKDQMEILKEKAAKSGMKTSSYLRWCGLNAPQVELVSRMTRNKGLWG